MTVWELLLELEHDVRSAISRYVGQSGISRDEIYSECVMHWPSIIENWRPWNCSLRGCIWTNMRWYAYKAASKAPSALEQLPGSERSGSYEDSRDVLEAVDEVHTLLESLSPEHSRLITMHLLLDLTFDEMAYELRVSKGTARNRYLDALAALRARVLLG